MSVFTQNRGGKFSANVFNFSTNWAILATTGSIKAPFQPPIGNAFSDIKAPLGVELNKTKVGSKTGEAFSESFVGLVAIGDSSLQAAAKAGDLKTIYHADYHYFNILGIYQKTTVIVNGE